MFLTQIDLTPALRPSLLQDESLLFVQDNVGLYEGKFKIPEYQNGQVYLTSHRICYIGHDEPRKHAVAVYLKDVDKHEFYAGFLKSSPKVTLIPNVTNNSPALRGQSPHILSATQSRHESPQRSPAPATNATWVCRICSFSNPMPPNFDPLIHSSRVGNLQPCKSCGIEPEMKDLVKAALQSRRQVDTPATTTDPTPSNGQQPVLSRSRRVICPRCTFDNEAGLLECEVCGARLPVPDPRLELDHSVRTPSPGPALGKLSLNEDTPNPVKFSFRANDKGEKVFYERLKAALVQRKWLLGSAPPIPQSTEAANARANQQNGRKLVGIAGLEFRGKAQRISNERLIGNAFEDLEALMISAKEIIALAESFSNQARQSNDLSSEDDSVILQSASALGLATTKDMLGSDTLYISELSRNLAEFLLDDSKGVLHKGGGVMSLVDVWAVFNRARNGVELVSPADFQKAAELWEKLKLPIRLRRFKSGLLVVQGRDRTDKKTISNILAWLKEFRDIPPSEPVAWDWQTFGKGVTIQDAAKRFGWSMGIATEELEMAEERGILCRDQGLDGVRFWENWLTKTSPAMVDPF